MPDTDALAASATAYNVTAQVKSSAGNGNNANISNGTVTVNAAIDYTPTGPPPAKPPHGADLRPRHARNVDGAGKPAGNAID
ncbi:hypothetical protein ECZU17_34430 [Escherichia coli]|nr:hypothetical protein ECZU17_34430 [Escherichia coli]